MGHFGRRIWCWHSFLNLTQGNVNFRSNWVKLGQISKFKKLSPKYPCLVKICLRIPKMSSIFMHDNWNATNCISQLWRHHLYRFFAIAKRKTKILLWNFVCVLFLFMPVTYIPIFFVDNLKIYGFIGNYFSQIEILNFWGQNRKI